MKKTFISLFLLMSIVTRLLAAAPLTVQQLTCEYNVNPLGIDLPKPRLSWILTASGRNVLQTAYEIRVSQDAAALAKGQKLAWSSGKVNSDQSVLVPYAGEALQPGKKYYWQVRVWDNQQHTSAWSAVNSWETGLLDPGNWSAKWIEVSTPTDGKPTPVPMFRKNFALAKTVKNARLYTSAHGLYLVYLNGQRVGNDYFRPGWTSYAKHLQYQTYDVTNLLKKGNNAAGAMVGDGWFRGNLAFHHKRNTYGKEVAYLFQLEVTYTDGTTEKIISDNSWKWSFDGPVLASDIYNGETVDARKTIPGWAESTFNDASWQTVRAVDGGKEHLVAQSAPGVVRKESFRPVKMIVTPKGELVADFGQNLTGFVQVRLKGRAGDSIILHHAEVLDKAGNFYTENLRSAQQENKFILKGGQEEVFEPGFTFQGFRYVRLSGSVKADSSMLTAFALYSDMAPTGDFTCSHPLINQLQHNIQWGQKGNFVDVPTDCPQRDERLGWTGDAQVFFNTAAYNMDVAGFFTKWLKDVSADQREDGAIPHVIPQCLNPGDAGSAGWADVSTIIPWNFYVAYGDKEILQRQYASMKAWVGFMQSKSKDNLWNTGGHFGDWLFYRPDDDTDGRSAITDKYLIAQCFYACSIQNLINAANVLGNTDDVNTYNELLKAVKSAFVREYVTATGRLVSSSQTAYVLALNFDMLPEEVRAAAAKRLADNVASYGNHLTTGFLGTPYLCHVLTRFGYTDVAYKLLMQESYPSWLYPVKKGATTIWERWDGIKPDGSFQNAGMNSFNHYAYGAIGDWMYKTVAGIRPDEMKAGYKHILIAPKPGGGLTSATASHKTMYGEVKSSWKISNGKLVLDVHIPVNTTAQITVNGENMNVGSGDYHYEYAWAQ